MYLICCRCVFTCACACGCACVCVQVSGEALEEGRLWVLLTATIDHEGLPHLVSSSFFDRVNANGRLFLKLVFQRIDNKLSQD